MNSNVTSIRCNRDSDSFLAAVATSCDFCNSIGTYETYWLGEVGSAFEVKPDIGPSFEEVRD